MRGVSLKEDVLERIDGMWSFLSVLVSLYGAKEMNDRDFVEIFWDGFGFTYC